jgi:hypothetical protein
LAVRHVKQLMPMLYLSITHAANFAPDGCACLHCWFAGLPTWLEAKAALAEVQELSSSMAADPAPAIVTFVSNGYQPILNNWLAWLKHSGADVARVVVVTPRGHESSVRGKLMYQDVHVVAIDVIEPDVWEPRSSHELGAQKDPNRHARAK